MPEQTLEQVVREAVLSSENYAHDRPDGLVEDILRALGESGEGMDRCECGACYRDEPGKLDVPGPDGKVWAGATWTDCCGYCPGCGYFLSSSGLAYPPWRLPLTDQERAEIASERLLEKHDQIRRSLVGLLGEDDAESALNRVGLQLAAYKGQQSEVRNDG